MTINFTIPEWVLWALLGGFVMAPVLIAAGLMLFAEKFWSQ